MGFRTFCAVVSLLSISPSLEAGAWTQPKGTHWFKAGFMFQDTTERYFIDGERTPYFFDGRSQTRALFLELVTGLTDRWDVKAQIPIFGISFNDIADERTSTGPGDLRVESRYNLLNGPVVLTAGGAVKFPTGEFVNDAEIVPVGEGQYDFDVFAEVGKSLWPVRGYVTGKVGYRFRAVNAETEIDYGNEIIWRVEGGYQFTTHFFGKLLVRGLHGFDTSSFDIPLESLKRAIVYVEPGVSIALSPSRGIELSVPISVSGRNWPAGPVFNVSFTQSF